MTTKAFIRQRICAYAGVEFDPAEDQQVKDVLRNKFNIQLPQRRSLIDSLKGVASDHEVIELIIQYRTS